MEPLNWWKHFYSGLHCVSSLVSGSWWWYDWTKWFTGDVSVLLLEKKEIVQFSVNTRLLGTVPIPPMLPPEAKARWAWMAACFQAAPRNLGVLGPGASLAWQEIQPRCAHEQVGSRTAEQVLPAFPAQLWELGLRELGCSCRWVRRKGHVRWDWRKTRDTRVQRHQWEEASGLVLSAQPASLGYASLLGYVQPDSPVLQHRSGR